MKKSIWIYILALVLGLMLLCGCGDNVDTSTDTETETETEVADSETQNDEIIISSDTLNVLKKNGQFIVKISEEKEVIFDSQRNAVEIKGIELKEINNIYSYLGKEYDKINMTLGTRHLDAKDAQKKYYPSYITKDAYLISFVANERDDIYKVQKTDLLTNELVDEAESDIQYWDTVERLYMRGESNVFLKLKVNRIYDGLYTGGEYSDELYSGVTCVLLECSVVEDYYNLLSNDEIVTIPIYLSTFYNEEDIKAFVSKCDYLCVYGSTICAPILSGEGEEVEVTNPISVTSLDNYSVVPIINGKVDLDALDSLLSGSTYLKHNRIEHFDQMIVNGMNEEELAESIGIYVK